MSTAMRWCSTASSSFPQGESSRRTTQHSRSSCETPTRRSRTTSRSRSSQPADRSELVANLAANLPEGLLLELPNALARQVVLVADLLQRELVLVVQTEP